MLPFCYPSVETYLRKNSLLGWKLISYSQFCLVFERTTPKERHYFIWHRGGYLKSDGKYNLELRYWNILKQFGVSQSQSSLNKYTKRKQSFLRIIEVQQDELNSTDYLELIIDRNKLYRLEALRNCFYSLLVGCCFCINILSERYVFLLVGLFLIVISIVYAVLSWILLRAK